MFGDQGYMSTLHLDVPDFAVMTDDEVDRHALTRMFDGRWSAQTRLLMERFGVQKLDLNKAWAQTWIGWSCPCCGRSKSEIARLTDNGVLLCQLDWHHDHLGDCAGDIMRTKALTGADQEVDVIRKRACSAAIGLIERFAPVVLCNDCNAADAAMKALIGSEVPRSFSFVPSEIARFIDAKAAQPHDINDELGRALWTAAIQEFQQRLQFAEMMGGRIAMGFHDREITNFPDPSLNYDDPHFLYKLAWETAGVRQRPNGLSEALLARSRSSSGRSATSNLRRRVCVPTQAEFKELDLANSRNSGPWRKAGADWQCPCCERSKFEIMRLSNRGEWRAAVMMLNEYELETDAESIGRRKAGNDRSFFISGVRQVGVCQDCRQIVADASRVRPGSEQDSLKLSDIRELIGVPAAHQTHQVCRDEVSAILDLNADWLAAVKDFQAHREEVVYVNFELYKLRRNTGIGEEAARAILLPQLVASGHLPADDTETWFDWMYAEAKRLTADQ